MLTPMMRQYLDIKEQYKDCIVFFRLGDFYEMFFEDAVLASRELEIALTGKDCGLEERAPMCGVPFHAVDSYIKSWWTRAIKWPYASSWKTRNRPRAWWSGASSGW